jgi:hypothetical protein
MADGFLFEKLSVLNDAYCGTLAPSKTNTQTHTQVSVIKTKLFPHQATMVNGMHLYRDKMTRGFLLGNQAINGKIGIIGDSPGSGKSLTTLAYLASHVSTFPRMTSELTNNSSKYFFSHEINTLSDASSTNLIIVPHSLFGQWRHEIMHHTNLEYVPIETKRPLRGTDLAQSIINSSFVLTTNKCYKFVNDYANTHGIQWNNICIDEASSIYINSSDPPLNFQFLWLITNNWIPLLFKNPSISKNSLYYLKERVGLHPDLERWLLDSVQSHYEGNLVSSVFLRDYIPFFHKNRGSIILRNSNEYIQTSLQLPSISTEVFQCRPNLTLNSLTSYYLARNIEPNIVSEKIPNLFQALGIEFKSLDEYRAVQPESKQNVIKRKSEENDCIICFDKCEYPTIVKCCYNIFCAKCLLKNTLLNQKCPTCREILTTGNISCLISLSAEQKVKIRNKIEIFLDLLKSNKTSGKFIVYSSFDNIYYQLFEEINKLGIKAERIESNHFLLLKTIKNYQEGETNVLFISNIELIRGVSLEATSHLVFFHELPVYELKQILIHSAQRIGRVKPLKILQLNSEIPV